MHIGVEFAFVAARGGVDHVRHDGIAEFVSDCRFKFGGNSVLCEGDGRSDGEQTGKSEKGCGAWQLRI